MTSQESVMLEIGKYVKARLDYATSLTALGADDPGTIVANLLVTESYDRLQELLKEAFPAQHRCDTCIHSYRWVTEADTGTLGLCKRLNMGVKHDWGCNSWQPPEGPLCQSCGHIERTHGRNTCRSWSYKDGYCGCETFVPPTPPEPPEPPKEMMFKQPNGTSFRCDCGCNVFTKRGTNVTCNACQTLIGTMD